MSLIKKLIYILICGFLFTNVLAQKKDIPSDSSTIVNIPIPQHVIDKSLAGDDGLPLEVPVFKYGVALLKGYINGYNPKSKYKGDVHLLDIVQNESTKIPVSVSDSGTFELKIPLLSSTETVIRTPFYTNSVILSPDKETIIYVDLVEKNRLDSIGVTGDPYKFHRHVYFSGANENLNNLIAASEIYQYFEQNFTEKYIRHDALFLTNVYQYKDYLSNKLKLAEKDFQLKGITGKLYTFALVKMQLRTLELLMLDDYFIYYENKKYTPVLLGFDYYSQLEGSYINSPYALYFSSYGGILNLSHYLTYSLDKYKMRYRLKNITGEMIRQLIGWRALQDKDLDIALSLASESDENWSEKRRTTFTKQNLEFAEKLLETGRIGGDCLKLVNYLKELCMQDKVDLRLVSDVNVNVYITVAQYEYLSAEELQKINDSVFKKDERPQVVTDEYYDFINKYRYEIEFMQECEFRDGEKQTLISLLDTDKGIVFDLMRLSSYGKKIRQKIPLTQYELEDVAALGNPNYTSFMTVRNDTLIAQNDRRKVPSNMHRLLNVTDDELFDDVLGRFRGKIVCLVFWSTWSVAGIPSLTSLEALKKEFPGDEIVYVYVADATSSIRTWEHVTPTISGEHYMLTTKQFSYLSDFMKVKGLPYYMLFDKKGKRLYGRTGYAEYLMRRYLNENVNRK